MVTRKITMTTDTEFATDMANLRGIVRTDFFKRDTQAFSFILDKVGKLEVAPIVQEPVHSLTSPSFFDACQIFHNNLVTIKIGNDLLTDVVVYPSHKTSFSSAYLFQKTFCRTSAFSLEFATQMFESTFCTFDTFGIVKFVIGCNSNVFNAQVDTKSMFAITLSDFILEAKHKKASTFFIDFEQTFTDIPSEVFFIAIWDIELKLIPFFEQSQYQDITFEVSISWEIKTWRCTFNNRLGLCFFEYCTRLFNTRYCELGWQMLSDTLIDKRMELDVVFDTFTMSDIDTDLQTSSIPFNSSSNLWNWLYPDFCSSIGYHNQCDLINVFKASHPRPKERGIRSEVF